MYLFNTVSIELNSGANLISFYALPENIEFQNFVSPLLENVTGVITEGSSSILFENQWLEYTFNGYFKWILVYNGGF